MTRRTAILRDPLFLEHRPGPYHVESPDRLEGIYAKLDRTEAREKFLFPAVEPAGKEVIALNHTAAHIARIEETAGRAFDSLDPDTHTSPLSYQAACKAAGAVVQGVSLTVSGKADNAFALIRPPGHHAERHRAMGFCLFNNVAIGARFALQELGLKRILVVDWDLHHGNGTQHSFFDCSEVLYFSTHQYPYYPGTGGLDEVGVGAGEGFTVNVPLPGGQDGDAFGKIFEELLTPIARQYRPELVLVSAGFDIARGDPLGTMQVTTEGFALLARLLLDLAAELCAGRLVAALEGGYHLRGLEQGVFAVLEEMAGREKPEPRQPLAPTRPLKVLEQVKRVQSRYWRL